MNRSVSIDTVPVPHPIRVALPGRVANDIKLFQEAQLKILDRLGCLACCSGFDIRFDTIRDFAIDEDMNVLEVAGRIVGGL